MQVCLCAVSLNALANVKRREGSLDCIYRPTSRLIFTAFRGCWALLIPLDGWGHCSQISGDS